MDSFKLADYNDLENDVKQEKFYRFVLSKKVAESDLEKFQLRYIPDYIRELRIKKVYWGKEYRKCHDAISLKNWISCAQQLQEEIKKHKIMLRNLDFMRILFVRNSDDLNYFSQSLDPERVEALVACIRENESNDNIILDMLNDTSDRDQKTDYTHTFYVVYASCAMYGEFRIRPSRPVVPTPSNMG